MEINYIVLAMNLINIGIMILIIVGIFKGIKGLKKFIIRNKEMDEKLDKILDKLEGDK